MIIDNVNVDLYGDMEEAEIREYIDRGKQMYGNRLVGISLTEDGEYVDIAYHLGKMPFVRIRRITGYLVGGLDRFNDGKLAEEKARVKHGLGGVVDE